MLKSYLQTAIRNLTRHKSFTLISVFSLIVGITCFIFLMLYVKYEISYDSFHENSGRIYQAGQKTTKGDFFGYKETTLLSGAFAPTVKRDFPEVENAARTKKAESYITYNNNGFKSKGMLADQEFLKMFSFPIKTGDVNSALREPGSAVLTETFAVKLFGNEDPIGKTIKHEFWGEFKVTSVIKDPPENSNFKFEFLLSFSTLTAMSKQIEASSSWGTLNFQSFIQLKEKVNYKDFEKKLALLVNNYHPKRVKDVEYFLLPLSEVHLSSSVLSEFKDTVDKKYIYLLATIAVLVLLIGCVNYMNIATARAGTRNKEVGIRKTVGANRIQLIKQFLSESFLLTFISIILSLILVSVTFPFFKEIAGNGIGLGILSNWTTMAGVFALFIIVGLFAGGYPAFVLSSLSPANMLKKGAGKGGNKKQFAFRNALVVFQFIITIILVIGAVIIQKQMSFIKNSDIGYQRGNVVAVQMMNKEARDNYRLIKNDLSKNPNIISIAGSDVTPLSIWNINDTQIENEKGEMKNIEADVSRYSVDNSYVSLFDIKIITGRNFLTNTPENFDEEVLINETAAKMAGLNNPIGKRLIRDGKERRITGVVKDFHFASMKSAIAPLIITYSPAENSVLFAKISDNNVPGTLAEINNACKKYSKGFIFNYSFMDELYGRMYKKESDLGTTVLSFSIITILIASIGLYGLISFIIERKTKEIGVRKVLGASVAQMVWLIIKDFFLLLLIALAVSLPVAHYLTGEWLKEFAYHINVNVWLFGFAIALVMVISFLSIGSQTIKAAIANPVNSLKSE